MLPVPDKAIATDVEKRSQPPPGTSEEQKTPAKRGGQQLVDPQQSQGDTKPGSKNAPVTISAVGNTIIINSDDPDAVKLAQELVRLLTQAPATEGSFEIIRLKNTSAADAAKTVDELFNGKPEPVQPIFPFPGRGGRRFAPPPPVSKAPARVRVVADTASNSLLVKATPLDMLEIKRILDKSIDSGDTDSSAIMRTWPPLPLKYAKATDLASIIRDVYKENTNPNGTTTGPVGRGRQGFFSRRFLAGINGNNGNGARTVTLTLGVDDRSNSLIVNCSELLYRDIKELAGELDLAARDSARTYRVLSFKGLDPALVQHVVDAVQGRNTNTGSYRTGNSGSGVSNPGSSGRGSGRPNIPPTGGGGARSGPG
jgi:type II secretory pathway component GspD/PulD (secretin)